MPLVPIFSHPEASAVAISKWGEGMVIVLSSSWSLSNQGVGEDDNLVLVLNALNHRDASRELSVTFDEFRQGYGRSPGIESLIGTSARLGIAQILMAFLLLLLAVSRRFGKPIPLREGFRQRNEYLNSMSSLLRRAHALDMVKRELERKFVEDTAVALGLQPRAERDAILEAASIRRPDKLEELRQLMNQPDAISESALLALAGRWYQMRKDLMRAK